MCLSHFVPQPLPQWGHLVHHGDETDSGQGPLHPALHRQVPHTRLALLGWDMAHLRVLQVLGFLPLPSPLPIL